MSSVYSEEEKSYGLSRARLVEFKEAFDYFDEDYTSLLPVDRLQHHLKQMGYNATDMELDKFEVDVSKQTKLLSGEFQNENVFNLSTSLWLYIVSSIHLL